MKGSRGTLCVRSTDTGRAGVEVSKHPLVEFPNACLYTHCRSRVLCGGPPKGGGGSNLPPELQENERLKNIEPRMIELITNEVR